MVLFLVSKRVIGLRNSCARVLAFIEFCSREYFFKGTPSFVRYQGRFLENVVKQWLLCYEMPAVHEIGFKLGTSGWYCLTKGEIFLFCFCSFRRAGSLSLIVTSGRVVWMKFSGHPLLRRCVLKFVTLSSKNVLEELVLSSLRASPLMKPLFTADGRQVDKLVYWNVSVGLKWVRTSSTDSVLSLPPL